MGHDAASVPTWLHVLCSASPPKAHRAVPCSPPRPARAFRGRADGVQTRISDLKQRTGDFQGLQLPAGTVRPSTAMWFDRCLSAAARHPSLIARASANLRVHSTMTRSPARGALIVFEGVDRAGKSTQCELLSQHLGHLGVRGHCTCLSWAGTAG